VGGAFGELDPQSPVNPSSLVGVRRTVVFAEYAPEFRRVSGTEASEQSTLIRFPLLGAILPYSQRGVLSLSAATMLDRSWATRLSGEQVFGDETVEYSDEYIVTGALNDVRVASSWALGPSLAVGIGAHVITGENQLDIFRTFADTALLGFGQRTTVGYTGFAASGGISWWPSRALQIGASGRAGGGLRAFVDDSTIARASVPSRASVGAQYAGVAGTVFGARVSWEGWSSLSGVTPEALPVEDTWDIGIGVETRGPALFATALPLRVGYRHRGLPFHAAVDGTPGSSVSVTENTFSFGTALHFSAQRATIDLTALRSSRSGHPTVSERGWGVNVGLTVRP
jgi:hypothetical protein